MKKIVALLFIVFSFVLLTFLLTAKKPNNNQVVSGSPQYKTLENSEGEVVVEVRPISLSSKENIRFNISLNTHSVELDKNLKDISVLVDDKGNEYKPVMFSGGESGHHIEGELVFPKLLQNASKVTLTIKGIAGIDRAFRWDL